MENNPKKSKAIIITISFVVLLLLIFGYYLFRNRSQIFDAKGSTSVSKIFAPLLGTSKNNGLNTVDDGSNTSIKKVGTVTTDAKGNKTVSAEAGEDIKKGDAVYISGFDKNGNPIVMKAIANDKNKSLVLGIADKDIKKGNKGNILIDGNLEGTSTGQWKAGDPLYLSDSVAGMLTKNIPVGSSLAIQIGNVMRVDGTNGTIYVGNLSRLITTGANGSRMIPAIGGENLSNGDLVYIVGYDANGNPIVMKATPGAGANSLLFTISGNIVKGSMGSMIVNTNVTLGSGDFGKGINTGLLNSSSSDINTYWGSIFGSDSYKGTTLGTNGFGTNGFGTSGFGTNGFGEFGFNPINIPGSPDNKGGDAPAVILTANPSTVKYEGSSKITWQSVNAESCSAGAGNGTGKTGSFNSGKLTKTTSFTVTCLSKTGVKATNSIVVVVEDDVPTVTVTATPSTVKSGGESDIQWVSNVENCNAGPGNGTGKTGSFDSGVLTNTTSFIVTCTGKTGIKVPGSVVVYVEGDKSEVPTVAVTATPPTVPYEGESDIQWVSNVENCNAGPGNGKGKTGSFDSGKLTKTTSFIVTCTGKTGIKVPGSVVVYVDINSYIPTLEVTAKPSTVKSGGESEINWTSTNTKSCSAGAGNGTGKTGSFDSGVLTKTKSFTVVCTGVSGITISGSVAVSVEGELGVCADKTKVNYPDCNQNGVCTDITKVNYPDCNQNGVCTDPTKTNYPKCDTDKPKTDPEINKCSLIDQNPLKFTDAQQGRLAELLRKFYILAPKIKTADDITNIYNEMDQYKLFVTQIDGLTNQCKIEKGAIEDPATHKTNTTYRYPTTTQGGPGYNLDGGNPWYNNNKRTTYITDTQVGKTDPTTPGFCYGTIKRGPSPAVGYLPSNRPGQSCSQFTTANTCISQNGVAGDGTMWETTPDSMTGCEWIKLSDYESILNIW